MEPTLDGPEHSNTGLPVQVNNGNLAVIIIMADYFIQLLSKTVWKLMDGSNNYSSVLKTSS